MSRPVPNQGLKFVTRLRFQILAVWFVAVALPGSFVYAGFITAGSYTAILNSVLGCALASFVGLIVLRRVSDFPGSRSYALILPSITGSYGLILLGFFAMRLSYSRTIVIASFVLALIVAFLVGYLSERYVKLRFFAVPGGDVESLSEIEHAEWTVLNSPTIPRDHQAMFVADFRHDHDGEWERMLAMAAVSGHVVYHSKQLRESLTGRVNMEHLSENSFGSLVPNLAYRKSKRALDLALCAILLPMLVIPFGILAICIKLDSAGPVIFRQPRVGYRGEIFHMLKFRSMRPRETPSGEHEMRSDAMTKTDDKRVTRVGRFIRKSRLDELPQIFNIISGDMSWIGPRPEAVPLSQWYEKEIPFYSYRHIIRPGITGWAQVHQGHVTDLDEISMKLSYDFYYVKFFSAWLDIVILLRTIPTMIAGIGAR